MLSKAYIPGCGKNIVPTSKQTGNVENIVIRGGTFSTFAACLWPKKHNFRLGKRICTRLQGWKGAKVFGRGLPFWWCQRHLTLFKVRFQTAIIIPHAARRLRRHSIHDQRGSLSRTTRFLTLHSTSGLKMRLRKNVPQRSAIIRVHPRGIEPRFATENLGFIFPKRGDYVHTQFVSLAVW